MICLARPRSTLYRRFAAAFSCDVSVDGHDHSSERLDGRYIGVPEPHFRVACPLTGHHSAPHAPDERRFGVGAANVRECFAGPGPTGPASVRYVRSSARTSAMVWSGTSIIRLCPPGSPLPLTLVPRSFQIASTS